MCRRRGGRWLWLGWESVEIRTASVFPSRRNVKILFCPAHRVCGLGDDTGPVKSEASYKTF